MYIIKIMHYILLLIRPNLFNYKNFSFKNVKVYMTIKPLDSIYIYIQNYSTYLVFRLYFLLWIR